MPQVSFIHESREIDLNAVERTDEGFLVLNAYPAKAGDYEYYAHEVWDLFPMADPNETVIGHMKSSELKKAFKSLKGAIITNDHPFPFVNFDNISELQVGHMGDKVKLDGDLVNQKAYITNGSMIAEVEAGKQELSIGFTADLQKVENRTEDQPHFYIRNIKVNHVAVVDKGKAGEQARLTHSKNGGALLLEQRAIRNSKPLNHKTKEKIMPKVMIHNVSYEVEPQVADAIAAQNLAHNEAIADKQKQIDDGATAMSTIEAERDDLKAKVDDLSAKSDETAIANAVKAELAFSEKVLSVDADYKHEIGADKVAVMRDQLANAKKDFDYSEKSDAYIEAAFDILCQNKDKGAGVLDQQVSHSATVSDADTALKNAQAKRNGNKGE